MKEKNNLFIFLCYETHHFTKKIDSFSLFKKNSIFLGFYTPWPELVFHVLLLSKFGSVFSRTTSFVLKTDIFTRIRLRHM